MLKILKQARSAFAMLNPEEVRERADRPLHIGLVAVGGRGYEELENFLLPADLGDAERLSAQRFVHRADDPDVPHDVDLVLYQDGVESGEGAYTFNRRNPSATIEQILDNHDELALALARNFPPFRKPVVEQTIHSIARENAMFAVATALPNILPNLLEGPWALGEFASDMAFLTANQVRMAFLIAAACGKETGLAQQKGEVFSIVASGFGWRAIARELVGKIPFGGGLIPKGAIAYAGTVAVGKGLEYLHYSRTHHTPEQREQIYQEAYRRGKDLVAWATKSRPA